MPYACEEQVCTGDQGRTRGRRLQRVSDLGREAGVPAAAILSAMAVTRLKQESSEVDDSEEEDAMNGRRSHQCSGIYP